MTKYILIGKEFHSLSINSLSHNNIRFSYNKLDDRGNPFFVFYFNIGYERINLIEVKKELSQAEAEGINAEMILELKNFLDSNTCVFDAFSMFNHYLTKQVEDRKP